jgi:hypothetical protein
VGGVDKDFADEWETGPRGVAERCWERRNIQGVWADDAGVTQLYYNIKNVSTTARFCNKTIGQSLTFNSKDLINHGISYAMDYISHYNLHF